MNDVRGADVSVAPSLHRRRRSARTTWFLTRAQNQVQGTGLNDGTRPGSPLLALSEEHHDARAQPANQKEQSII